MESAVIEDHRVHLARIPGLGFWEWDIRSDRLVWSDELLRMFGIERQPGVERGFTELVHPEDRVRVEAEITSFLSQGEAFAHEFRIVRADGGVRHIHDRGVIERDASGAAVRMYGVNIDVTDHRVPMAPVASRAMQDALALSEARLAGALRAGRLGVHEYYPQLDRVLWDDAVRDIWGVRPTEQITYETFAAGLHQGDLDRVNKAVAAALEPGGPGRYECEYRVRHRKTGELRWVRADGDVTFENGLAVRLIGTARDVTERKLAEAELAETKRRFETALKNSPVTIFEQDRALRYTWLYNPLLGFEEDKIIGRGDDELLPPSIRDQLVGLKRAVIEEGRGRRTETEIEGPQGYGAFDLIVEPKHDEHGAIVGVVCVSTDITVQKRSEEALAAWAREIEAVYNAAPVGIVMFDRDLRFVRVNDRMAQANGLPRNAHIGRAADDILPETTVSALREIRERLFSGEDLVEREFSAAKPTGEMSHWHLAYRALRNKQGEVTHLLGVVQDITERRNQEAHVRMLLDEIDHRAKNVLAVVQAIARQSARGEPKDFLTSFNERLRSLAASNDLLVKGDWRGVDLGELARAQLSHVTGMSQRVSIAGPPLAVSATAAQTLGMALHELATNALKHGALSNAEGGVELAWELRPCGVGAKVVVEWSESGGPEVVQPRRRGFGRTVVEAAGGTLGADVKLVFDPAGVIWTLECQLDRIAADGGSQAAAPPL